MSALTFTHTQQPRRHSEQERDLILSNPGFGTHFTDYMAHARWTKGEGWHSDEVIPYGPLELAPGAAALHYAQEIFEGMKVYRHPDGSVWTFRPELNAKRLQRSAERLVLPSLPVEDFLTSVREYVRADEPWVPAAGSEASLYVRPFMFASEEFLGVRAAEVVDYYVIASPSGPYFPRGVQPLIVWVTDEYARAGAGGTGAAKCGGNYASSLFGKRVALENGAEEIMFLDSESHRYIDELSGMNVFVVTADQRIITPALTGSILEGITRSSVLEVAADRGLTPCEERLEYAQVKADVEAGRITEMFACGTAAIITPIGELRDRDGATLISGGAKGEHTMAIREEITGIQYGRIEDTRGWMMRLA